MTDALYTYAFLPVPDPELADQLEKIEGLIGPIRMVSAAGSSIAAAVETLTDLSYLESSDEILLRSALRHDQVICQLFSQLQVLPLRFGTCFVSDEKLQDHLLIRQADYEQALLSITGRAEYLLKAFVTLPPSADPETAASGTAYLLAKKQAYLRQQQLFDQIKQALSDLQDLWPQDWPQRISEPQGEEYLRQYFLLSESEYQQALVLTQDWLQDRPTWSLEWSTALPPYHFVHTSSES